MFALKAEHVRGRGYAVTVKTGADVDKLGAVGWLVFTDPAVMLAEVEAGKIILNMRYEKREAIIVQLRTMVGDVTTTTSVMPQTH